MKAVAIASLAAIAVQPLLFALWFILPTAIFGNVATLREVVQLFTFVIIFAAGFMLLLGLPLFFALRRFGLDTWSWLAAAGFLVASIPVGVLGWPIRKGASAGGGWYRGYVEFVIDGVPTIYGWLQYAESVLMYGVHGVVGALLFLCVWRRYRGPNNVLKGRRAKRARP